MTKFSRWSIAVTSIASVALTVLATTGGFGFGKAQMQSTNSPIYCCSQ